MSAVQLQDSFSTKAHVLKPRQEVHFDPDNTEHRLAYATYAKTGKWPIRFTPEWPCVTVPQTVLTKLAEYACRSEAVSLDAKVKTN